MMPAAALLTVQEHEPFTQMLRSQLDPNIKYCKFHLDRACRFKTSSDNVNVRVDLHEPPYGALLFPNRLAGGPKRRHSISMMRRNCEVEANEELAFTHDETLAHRGARERVRTRERTRPRNRGFTIDRDSTREQRGGAWSTWMRSGRQTNASGEDYAAAADSRGHI
eukprot:5356002-Pleurochrysis_carterae.AAC.1